MYEAYFGLRERPFELAPNPRFLLMTPRHREALTTLEYGLSARTGVALLVGEAGTGKTTLVHAALQSQETRQSLAVYLNNPSLTRAEFIEFLAAGFGLSTQAAHSKTRCLAELTEALALRHRSGMMSALIIDEAQCLPDTLLEEIRLLANIESASAKLLSIILAGQPEVAARLNHPSLRQLKQRIGLRCVLTPLTLSETTAYIAARVRTAGGEATTLFSPDTVQIIHQRSGGIPRTISVICDNALVSAFALDRRPIDRQIALEVCADFDFSESTEAVDIAPTFVVPEPLGPASVAPGPVSSAPDVSAAQPQPASDADPGWSAPLARLRRLQLTKGGNDRTDYDETR